MLLSLRHGRRTGLELLTRYHSQYSSALMLDTSALTSSTEVGDDVDGSRAELPFRFEAMPGGLKGGQGWLTN